MRGKICGRSLCVLCGMLLSMFRSFTRDQKVLLAVLTAINMFNYLDRQVIFPLFGHIKIEFGLTDFHLGLLGTAFLLVHSLAMLPMGMLADRLPRNVIIGTGVACWSVASFATGLAGSFRSMLAARSLVGMGEASYSPAAVAMLSDHFPDATNARVQGVFNIGMLIGGTLGAITGGLVAFYFDSWRLAFIIVAIPGVVLSYYAFNIKDRVHKRHDMNISVFSLVKNRAFLWIVASGTLVSFASGAFITWGIEFITRYKGYNLRDAGLILGLGMMVASVLGVLVGSYAADYFQKRYVWGRSMVVTVSLLLSMPLMVAGLRAEGGVIFLACFFFGTVLLSVYLGPVTAVLHDIVPMRVRASAYGAYVLVVNLLGQTFAPAVVGRISDTFGLRAGLEFAALFVFFAGLAFIPVNRLVGRYYDEARRV